MFWNTLPFQRSAAGGGKIITGTEYLKLKGNGKLKWSALFAKHKFFHFWVCVYVPMCARMYTYIQTYIHASYLHTYIHRTYIYYIHTYTYIHTYIILTTYVHRAYIIHILRTCIQTYKIHILQTYIIHILRTCIQTYKHTYIIQCFPAHCEWPVTVLHLMCSAQMDFTFN